MKALVKILSIFTFLLTIVILPIKAYAVEEPTKIINVVYDDSGSMIFDFDDTQQKVDTWCQAKYSMEVFAAMLGKKDIMNVYVMSDYYNKTASTPRLTLYGTDGSSANVEKVHKEINQEKGLQSNFKWKEASLIFKFQNPLQFLN